MRRCCELLATNAARFFGLYPRKGTLQPGSDADLAVWDATAIVTIRNDDLAMGGDWTPYEGFDALARPSLVLVRGEPVRRERPTLRPGGPRGLPRPLNRAYESGPVTMSRPWALDGIVVIDLTQYVAGPYCTQVLADLGARVIKIERPGGGDVYRRQGPVFVEGESASFLTLNRGKESVELDISREDDRARLLELLRSADVLVENMRPGVLSGFGLDFETLSVALPRLVYCSISGFGQVGPLAPLGGYDLTIQALSGVMSMTGHPGEAPAKVPIAALDFGSALYGVVGILAALRQREVTGYGQRVTTSILECALAWLSMHVVTYLVGGGEPRAIGTRSPFFAPYQAYRTEDGYIVVVGTGGTDAWGSLCRALSREDLLDDPRFIGNAERVANVEALEHELERSFTSEPTAEWERRLTASGIPCAAVQTLPTVLASPQVAALGSIASLEHPVAGTIPIVRLPLHMSDSATTSTMPPPTFGQHTQLVLDLDGRGAAAAR